MPKEKGDRKVETWKHRSGMEADIYLRGTRFVALFLERDYSAPEVATLRRALQDAAEHWMQLEWFGVIEIEVEDADGAKVRRDYDDVCGAELEFKRNRYWITQSPAGRVYRCAWEVAEAHRKAHLEPLSDEGEGGGYHSRRSHSLVKTVKLCGLPLRSPIKTTNGNFLLDYDPVLWDNLTGIIRSISLLRANLYEMTRSKKGIEALRNGNPGQFLLTGGGDDAN